MDVVCTLDDNYLIPTGVLLTSLCENNIGEDITVYIVAYQLKKETISSLENIVKGNYSQKIEFYYSSFEEVLGKFNLGNPEGHLSLAAFFRLFLATILPQDTHKVLYLDGDMIVRRNISDLWNTDIEDYALGGVEDESVERFIEKDLFTLLGFDEKYLYFNSGVLLINLDYWRQNNVENRLIQYAKKHKYQLPNNDQDLLNAVLYNEKKLLSLTYNLSDNFYRRKRNSRPTIWQETDSFLSDPHIVHFTGAKKPWLPSCVHPMQKEYFKYLDKTEWKGKRPRINILKKGLNFFRKAVKYRKV